MKRFLAIIGLFIAFGLIPFISFAQNEGDYCGGFNPVLCGVGLTCQLFSVGGDAGTCVSAGTTNGGKNNTPQPPAVPELPVWYRWLASWLTPQAPAITTPAAPVVRPAIMPTAQTFVAPPQQILPCVTDTTDSVKSSDSKNIAACAPRQYCVAGPLFDHEECAKPITARYQVKIDKIAQDLKDASKLIQDDWNKVKDKLDLNSITQNCIKNPRANQSLNTCFTNGTGIRMTLNMSDYLKKYSAWILDTSASDRDADILSQCGDPRTLKCDRYDFGCP